MKLVSVSTCVCVRSGGSWTGQSTERDRLLRNGHLRQGHMGPRSGSVLHYLAIRASAPQQITRKLFGGRCQVN